MSNIDEKYPLTSADDSVREKDWAAGTVKPMDKCDYYYDGSTWKYDTKTFAPAWLKIIDEIIVNAVDHIIRCQDEYPSNQVTKISITFDGVRVIVMNDGEGVEVVLHPGATKLNGKDTYVPTHIFGSLFQGSNRTKDSNSIIGGTNGLGAKIGALMSDEFTVTTVDSKRKLKFVQTWLNGKREVQDAVITKSNERSYTSFNFIPTVNTFGDTSQLVDVVRTRAVFAATYAQLCDSKIKLTFNNQPLRYRIDTICKQLYPTTVPSFCSILNGKFKWEIAVACVEIAGINQLSVVNGIVVSGGKHFAHVRQLILTSIKPILAKLFDISIINFTQIMSEYVFLIINAQIANVSWDGQRKDNIVMNTKELKLQLPNQFITSITTALKPIIEASMLKKTKKKKVDYEKYIPPTSFTGEKPIMIYVEGDSAMNQFKVGILANCGLAKIGIFSLGGVPMNLRKKGKIMQVGDRKLLKLTDQAKNNVVFKALFEELGLNTSYNYDPATPTYKKEMSELRFKQLVGGVDQDLDGKGNILGLVVNVFNYIWPNLVDIGFLGWFNTPIIRCFEKIGNHVLTYYIEAEFTEDTVNNRDYEIQYYKGIGTHSKESIVDCCKNLHSKIIAFYNDESSIEMFERYYGKLSAPRKEEMRKPLCIMSRDDSVRMLNEMRMSTTDLLKYETTAYCKDNLERKLDSAIDGQNQAGRKILHGILRAFATNTPMKVAQLAGAISKSENYHHGETSLHSSITLRAFIACGGKQLPFLIPLSNFGTRLCGGKKASPARYIYTKLNNKLTSVLFNAEDYHLLEFNFSEGERCEPKYYVPIIPLAVCESTEIPSTGWKLKTWARDVHRLISVVQNMIKFDTGCASLSICTYTNMHKWTGSLRYIRGKLNTLGQYWYDGDNIHITELPLRVWTMDYVEHIQAHDDKQLKIIKKIIDLSDDLSVNITIKLKPGSVDKLKSIGGDHCFTDAIEEYFNLYSHMDSHLNFMMPDYSVKEYTRYEDIVTDWFTHRKQLYAKRVERCEILQSVRIVMLEEQCRYAENKLKIGNLSKADQYAMLTTHKYKRLNQDLLMSPKFIPNDQLLDLIYDIVPNSDVKNKTYKYLLNMKDSDKSKESIAKKYAQLSILKKEQANYHELAHGGRFIGANIWLTELDKLTKVINNGQCTSWQFTNYNKHKY